MADIEKLKELKREFLDKAIASGVRYVTCGQFSFALNKAIESLGASQPKNALSDEKPVAYLRFRAAQQWSGIGGHDIENAEWYETCHAHEIGDDKQPAFPVYATPQAAIEAASAPNAQLVAALKGLLEYAGIIEERCGDSETNAARAALSAVGAQP